LKLTEVSEIFTASIVKAMKEAVSTSETVNLYETMRCNNPEDSHLQAADGV
jgi:hypothetical protein